MIMTDMLSLLKIFGITLEAFLLSVTVAEAGSLISTQNELAIQGGVVLLLLTITTAIASAFFWFPSLKNLIK